MARAALPNVEGALRRAAQGVNSSFLRELLSQFPITHAARDLLLA